MQTKRHDAPEYSKLNSNKDLLIKRDYELHKQQYCGFSAFEIITKLCRLENETKLNIKRQAKWSKDLHTKAKDELLSIKFDPLMNQVTM